MSRRCGVRGPGLVRVETGGSSSAVRFIGTRASLVECGFARPETFPEEEERSEDDRMPDVSVEARWAVERRPDGEHAEPYIVRTHDRKFDSVRRFRHAAEFRDLERSRLRSLLAGINHALAGEPQTCVHGTWHYRIARKERDAIADLGQLMLEILDTARVEANERAEPGGREAGTQRTIRSALRLVRS
jgi:hypothetical protein